MKSIQKRVEADFAEALSSLLDAAGDGLEENAPPLKIFTALSGGPDSTALLMLLLRFQHTFSYEIAAAYVNHGIRSPRECCDEQRQVEALCRQFAVPLSVKRYAPGFLEHYSLKKGCGLEASARTYRYHYFEKLSGSSDKSVFFALGHNSNDQIETVLMRLFSGSTIEGLRGIPLKRGRYIRPLLEIERSEIEDYLEALKISAVTDKSNLKTDFLRNKVRLDLLKTITRSFPSAQESVLRFNHDLKDILDHYSTLLEEHCPWVQSPRKDALSCSLSNFQKIPFVSRKRMILEQMNSLQKGLYSSDRRIPASFFNALEHLDRNTLLKGYGIILEKKGDKLVLALSEKPGGAGGHYSVYHIDGSHPYETDFCTVRLARISELEEEDRILYILSNDDTAENILVRQALSQAELTLFKVKIKELPMILYYKNITLCAFDSKRIFLPEGRKFKKISNIDSKNNAQCVIIKFRGQYAPG